MSERYYRSFAAVLRKLRLEKGLSQEFLALQIGVDPTYIYKLEIGRNSPSLETMLKLCEGLEVSLPELSWQIQTELRLPLNLMP